MYMGLSLMKNLIPSTLEKNPAPEALSNEQLKTRELHGLVWIWIN